MLLYGKSTAFVFPGQGSQEIGMGKALADENPLARHTFEEADAMLGNSFSRLMWNGPADKLSDTVNTQPALYVHSIAVLRVFMNYYPDFKPAWVAGHSLGELSALTAAGSLAFPDGLVLVRRRGELMKQAGQASPGGMAAILGLEISVLEKICVDSGTELEPVQVANDNCPGQVVISGAKASVERAIEGAKAAGAKRAIPLAVSIAAHSPLMSPVQQEFRLAVDSANILDATIPVIGNVHAKPIDTGDSLKTDLVAQLTSRVRWTESVKYLVAQGVHHFIEMGSGNVLGGLIRRISPAGNVTSLGNPKDFNTLRDFFVANSTQ